MYATVDFKNGSKRECAVLPTIWLYNKNKRCYWPKTKNEAKFVDLVKSNVPYDPKWPKYDVHKVVYTGDFETASQKLKDLIDGGLTDTGSTSQNSNAVAPSDRYSQEKVPPVKRKHKNKRKHKSSKKSKTSKRSKKSHVHDSDHDTDTNTSNSDAVPRDTSKSFPSLRRWITGLNDDGGSVSGRSESSCTDRNPGTRDASASRGEISAVGRDNSVPRTLTSGVRRDSSIPRGDSSVTRDSSVPRASTSGVRHDGSISRGDSSVTRDSSIPRPSTSGVQRDSSILRCDTSVARDSSVPRASTSGIRRASSILRYDTSVPHDSFVSRPSTSDRSVPQSQNFNFGPENPDFRPESAEFIRDSSNSRSASADSRSTSPNLRRDRRMSRDFGCEDNDSNRQTATSRHRVNTSVNTGFGEFGMSRVNTPTIEQLFRVLEGVGSMCKQNQMLLSAMVRGSKQSLDVAQRPVDTPPFPLDSVHEFEKYDSLLLDENHSSYLTRRLTALGGPNPRKLVMNIMRFLISDVVGMEYNWVGHNSKHAFNKKNTVKCITDAVRYNFNIKEGATDVAIADAIKDWLKQSKKRRNQRRT